jgi:hypothetical protein
MKYTNISSEHNIKQKDSEIQKESESPGNIKDKIINIISRCELELDLLATNTEVLGEEINSIPIICLDSMRILRRLLKEEKIK